MKVPVASAVALLAAAAQVRAWGPRAGPHGAPGNYSGPQTHGKDFQPDHILRVTHQNVSMGCQSRKSTVVNGTSPGPELRIKPGQTSWIRVYNDNDLYNLTMHWHGLSQRLAPFADGTPSASQWPIPPRHFYDYEVHPLQNESGTWFYHSHVGFQAVTATGPLIVEDDGPPPYAYDEERTIMFTDYFNKSDTTIEQGLTANPFVWSGETIAVLVNGVGVAPGESAGNGSCKLPVIDVEPGKIYRMRMIGATAISMVQWAIEDHSNFTIIEVDGEYSKPHQEEYMQLSSGQRFDVIFQTKTLEELQGKTDYLIQFETKMRPSVYYGYGVLRYSGGQPQIIKGPATPPMALSNATYAWAEYAFEPLVPNDFPSAAEVTRRIYIDSSQVLTEASVIWRMNGFQWNETSSPHPGDKPYLVNIYENGPSAMPNYTAAVANGGWDPEAYIWPAKIGEVLEIIWYNTGSVNKNNGGLDFHPFHAHGGHFFDIGSGNGTYNATANEEKLKNYHPIHRDTTVLYRYNTATTAGARQGWRAWRLRVEDAGVWMIHCHILQHMTMGMQTVWMFGDYADIAALPNDDVQGYLTYGGSVYGNETHDPEISHYFGDS